MASSSDFETSSNNIPYQGLDCHDENVLKKHVEYFDRNKDGVVYPWETFQGFRAIGCNIFLSTFASIFINVGLSGKTRPGKCPSLCFPIVVKNIQKAKHGSDSGVYDSEGRFVPSKFEQIFCEHAHTNPNALTSAELKEMRKANREPKDYGGWISSFAEWTVLYILCKDKNGLLQKDTIRGVYDGSLFEQMAEKKASAGKKKHTVTSE
ncbi:putative peroxygenase 4 [Camellia lanceoleosa]|uniref:Peroxygenase 4 n=1 Tax=Camellia lanceoleosa TaxID=1840588 RepID=A0ACC0G5A5_9ERIC|nr:putative peroxygenase 4 [Camellia lanceoleosa]